MAVHVKVCIFLISSYLSVFVYIYVKACVTTSGFCIITFTFNNGISRGHSFVVFGHVNKLIYYLFD